MTRRAVVFLGAARGLRAQEEARFRSDVRLVNVGFTARDARGRLVGDLTREEVEIREDGVVQDVRFFARNVEAPLTVGLIVDSSGSQRSFVRDHRRDVERFLEEVLGPRDRAFLLCFGNRLRLVADQVQGAEAVLEELKRFEEAPGRYPELGPREIRLEGTAFHDAVYYAAREKMSGVEFGRRALVVFSDGEDNSSVHHLLDAIEAAQSADAVVYSVRYTRVRKTGLTSRNKYGMRVMERLALETGGRDFDGATGNLRKIFTSIGEELRTMYEAAYRPSNPARDGRFRKLEVRLKRAEVAVRAKPGYFARE